MSKLKFLNFIITIMTLRHQDFLAQKHINTMSAQARTFLVYCISTRAYQCSGTTHQKKSRRRALTSCQSVRKILQIPIPLCLHRTVRIRKASHSLTHTYTHTHTHTLTGTTPGLHLNFKDSLHCHTHKQRAAFTQKKLFPES